MSAPLLLLAALLGPTGPEATDIRLTPLPAAGPDARGFLPARLVLDDSPAALPAVARGLAVRSRAGGPTVLYALAAAPGTVQAIPVHLPAVSVQETYVVEVLPEPAPDAPPLLRREIPVTFDDIAAVEAARARLIDPDACRPHLEDLPRWPRPLLRGVLLAGVLLAVMLGATLFIRHAAARIAAVMVLSAAGTLAALALPDAAETVRTRQAGDLLVVTARRTSRFSAPSGGLAPVYWRREQFRDDDLLLLPTGRLEVTIRPTDVRVFRRTAPAAR